MDTAMYRTASLPVAYETAFKDADIRGEYGSEINEVSAYRTMCAFVTEFAVERIVIARDMRLSSPVLHDACVAAARDMGTVVVDIGMVTTPTLYFVSGTQQVHGVMITASHNPAKYNGLKFVLPGAVPLTRRRGLSAMLSRVRKNDFVYAKKRGAIVRSNPVKAYQQHLIAASGVAKKTSARLLIDVGNGMAGVVTPLLKKFSHISVTELFSTPDGTFPHRDSNPNLVKNQQHVTAALRVGGYDFGVAFDGDADRVAFFDEKGQHINAAVIGALLVHYFAKKTPKAAYVYTVLTSRAYYDAITAVRAKPVRARVGHAFIKEQMKKHDAVFGCEHSAHFYFRDHFYADSGMLTLLHVLAAFSARPEGQTFSEFIAPYSTYHQTENKNVVVPDMEHALETTLEWARTLPGVTITKFDGVTISTSRWWCVVNKSVTDPALNVVVESYTKREANAVQKQIISFLKQHPHAH